MIFLIKEKNSSPQLPTKQKSLPQLPTKFLKIFYFAILNIANMTLDYCHSSKITKWREKKRKKGKKEKKEKSWPQIVAFIDKVWQVYY